jgi:transcriptional regulator with XRE-family HTH domain
MSKKTSILDKEIAKLLKSARERAGLYQADVAKRIGLSAKSGKGYIIEFPSKQKKEIDFERLKRQIKDKVIALVNKSDITLTPVLSRQEAVPKGSGAIHPDTYRPDD